MIPMSSTVLKKESKNDCSDFERLQKKALKQLQNEFQYDRQDLTIIFEYSGYDLDDARQILKSHSKRNVKTLIKHYLEHPQMYKTTDEVIDSKLNKTAQALQDNKPKESEMIVEESNLIPKPNPFDLITEEVIHTIFEFLDPCSLGRVWRTCKLHKKIASHPLLYKKFCLALYNPIPTLPEESVFYPIVHYINNSSWGEYTSQFKSKVNNNFREVIWGNLKNYYASANYFKQFVNFRGVFLQAPRVRFTGYYFQKEKYIRLGTKGLDQFYDPVHLIEYYRYFRFYPDGFVIHIVSAKKAE